MKRVILFSPVIAFVFVALSFVDARQDVEKKVPGCCPGVQQVAQVDPKKADDKAKPKADLKKHGRGFKLPPKHVRDAIHRISEAKYGHIRKALPVATAAVYDARVQGVIPPVGNQDGCGDCYMWSGCKAGASAQMVAGVVPKDGKFMLAPSFGLDCHPELGGCDGGDEQQVAQLIASAGWPSVAQYGGDGYTPGTCKPTTGMTLYTLSSVMMVSPSSGIASTQDIKNAIQAYGFCSIAAAAGSDWDNLGGGCTITGSSTDINHAIGYVGWDDNHDNGDGSKGAGIMQNNWDTSWGCNCANTVNPNPSEPGGYAWVKWGADSAGTEAFVCIAAAGPVPPQPPVPPVPPIPPTPPTPGMNPIVSIVATFQDGTTQTLMGVPTPGTTITPTTTLQQLLDMMQKPMAPPKKPGQTMLDRQLEYNRRELEESFAPVKP